MYWRIPSRYSEGNRLTINEEKQMQEVFEEANRPASRLRITTGLCSPTTSAMA